MGEKLFSSVILVSIALVMVGCADNFQNKPVSVPKKYELVVKSAKVFFDSRAGVYSLVVDTWSSEKLFVSNVENVAVSIQDPPVDEVLIIVFEKDRVMNKTFSRAKVIVTYEVRDQWEEVLAKRRPKKVVVPSVEK